MLDGFQHGPLRKLATTTDLDVLSQATSTLDRLGTKPTKSTCTKCSTPLIPGENWSKRSEGVNANYTCKTCAIDVNAALHIKHNKRSNAISALAYKIAGTSSAFYRLAKATRRTIRDTASEMYQRGLNFSTAERAEQTDKRGFVYVITNPAFLGFAKIGRAFDPESRLNSYQTGSPHRNYELRHAVYFEDCHFAEKEIHARLNLVRAKGEWFRLNVAQCKNEINRLRETI